MIRFFHFTIIHEINIIIHLFEHIKLFDYKLLKHILKNKLCKVKITI